MCCKMPVSKPKYTYFPLPLSSQVTVRGVENSVRASLGRWDPCFLRTPRSEFKFRCICLVSVAQWAKTSAKIGASSSESDSAATSCGSESLESGYSTKVSTIIKHRFLFCRNTHILICWQDSVCRPPPLLEMSQKVHVQKCPSFVDVSVPSCAKDPSRPSSVVSAVADASMFAFCAFPFRK